MPTAEYAPLIDQVILYLKNNPAAERSKVYSDHVAPCRNLGLTEDDFYKKVLKYAARSVVPTDGDESIHDEERVTGEYCKVAGKTVTRLSELGQVLFDNASYALKYLADGVLIKSHVDKLTHDADLALEFQSIVDSERDSYSRYLRVVYKLKSSLPFKTVTVSSANIQHLLNQGFASYQVWQEIKADFLNGRIKIWLEASNPDVASHIQDHHSEQDFLQFVYKVDPAYPYYLSDKIFYESKLLAAEATKNSSLWPQIYQDIDKGHLETWFKPAEHIRTANQLTKSYKSIKEEQKNDLVQDFILQASDSPVGPHVVPSIKEISAPTIEASNLFERIFSLELEGKGFVNASVKLENAPDGVSITPSTVQFFDLKNVTVHHVKLSVDPMRLIKDTEYNFNIIVTTKFQSITIPITVGSAFPRRAFGIDVLKYAACGALLFGGIRFLLSALIESSGWLNNHGQSGLPNDYSSFIAVFFVLVSGLAGAGYFFKRFEKIS
ncbi:MAG: hypothetical protein V4721_03260 [Bacteroidota bacterium]